MPHAYMHFACSWYIAAVVYHQQEMIIKVASLLLVFAMAGVICSGSRLLAVEGNHEDSTAARHEKQADFLPVESAGDADAAASDPADADNHHSLPRQSFGDWGNHQDQFRSFDDESKYHGNAEKN